MPTPVAAIPTNASFLGLAKEVTRGTALAATAYIPVKTLTGPNDMPHYAPDEGMRGSAVKTYDQVATQTWAEPAYSGDVFADTIGYWLYGLLGDLTTSGSAPTQHIFSVLNTSPFQPPSYCLTDYNGTDTFQVPGAMVEELSFKFTATGLLTYDVKFKGFKSTTTTKPTQSFSAEPVKAAWTGAVTLGGSSTSLLEDGELTIKRSVDPIPSVNGTQDPAAIWDGGDLQVTGKFNLIYTATAGLAEYTKMLNNTSTTLTIDFSLGAGAALRQVKLAMSKVLYTAAPHARSKSYVELPITFEAVANTTDIGASGGYGPLRATLKNAVTAY